MPSATVPRVLVLVGPTASGKTAVSLPLAQDLGGEIISADSRQMYKFLDIGTSKPTRAEREMVRHHFVDDLTPDKTASAGEFGVEGRRLVDEILQRGRVPIVVGGSGLYVRSLIDGLFEGRPIDKDCRSSLQSRLDALGLEPLVQELRSVDPESAARIDESNPRRVLRALEFYYATGIPLSRQHREGKIKIAFTALQFGLAWSRDALSRRIDARCDAMIAAGLLKEADFIREMGYSPSLQSLNTVGYKEAFAYRSGRISYEEMLRKFKQNSRRYAKRQLTWFRRDTRIHWIPMDESLSPAAVASGIAREYRAAGRT
jgi:tRNA dimethylallyltransferase